MDRRERLIGEPVEPVLAALDGKQATIWTALPAIVTKVDLAKMTLEVEAAIQARVRDAEGAFTWVKIPPLVDVPIIYPSGGGFTLTFPIEVGDECLVMFASRCIDAWWQQGGVQVQAELRMHDLSDGFAMVGPRSQPRVLNPVASNDAVELRKDDRTAYVKIADNGDIVLVTDANVDVTAAEDIVAAAGGNVDVTAGGSISMSAPVINLTGNVVIGGGTLTHNGVNVGSTHMHSGVVPGGGNTGAPT